MEKDVSKKNCLADNERYADLINGLLLDGEQQMKAEDLQDMDTQGLDEDAYDMAVQYTGATELIAVKKDYENGGKVNMCKALTEMLADERQEGIEQGKEKALFSLVRKGLISEVQAAEELGVSVGEFERLLKKYFSKS